MTSSPTLTGRDIGEAERAVRALLDRLLDEADLPFSDWTILFTLDSAGPLARHDLVQRQVHGLKVSEAAAGATVDGLRSSGLIAETGAGEGRRLASSAAGEAVFRPIRQAVSRITAELYGGLPQADLEAAHRVLAEVTRRANAHLAA